MPFDLNSALESIAAPSRRRGGFDLGGALAELEDPEDQSTSKFDLSSALSEIAPSVAMPEPQGYKSVEAIMGPATQMGVTPGPVQIPETQVVSQFGQPDRGSAFAQTAEQVMGDKARKFVEMYENALVPENVTGDMANEGQNQLARNMVRDVLMLGEAAVLLPAQIGAEIGKTVGQQIGKAIWDVDSESVLPSKKGKKDGYGLFGQEEVQSAGSAVGETLQQQGEQILHILNMVPQSLFDWATVLGVDPRSGGANPWVDVLVKKRPLDEVYEDYPEFRGAVSRLTSNPVFSAILPVGFASGKTVGALKEKVAPSGKLPPIDPVEAQMAMEQSETNRALRNKEAQFRIDEEYRDEGALERDLAAQREAAGTVAGFEQKRTKADLQRFEQETSPRGPAIEIETDNSLDGIKTASDGDLRTEAHDLLSKVMNPVKAGELIAKLTRPEVEYIVSGGRMGTAPGSVKPPTPAPSAERSVDTDAQPAMTRAGSESVAKTKPRTLVESFLADLGEGEAVKPDKTADINADIPSFEEATRVKRSAPADMSGGFSEAESHARSLRNRASESEPPTFDKHEVGEWTKDSDGEMWQLQELRLDDPRLVFPEGMPKNQTVEKYNTWLEAGNEPPPMRVVENVDGKLIVSDGHHRAAALKNAGRNTVQAWVSPIGKDRAKGKGLSVEEWKAERAAKPEVKPAPEPEPEVGPDELQGFVTVGRQQYMKLGGQWLAASEKKAGPWMPVKKPEEIAALNVKLAEQNAAKPAPKPKPVVEPEPAKVEPEPKKRPTRAGGGFATDRDELFRQTREHKAQPVENVEGFDVRPVAHFKVAGTERSFTHFQDANEVAERIGSHVELVKSWAVGQNTFASKDHAIAKAKEFAAENARQAEAAKVAEPEVEIRTERTEAGDQFTFAPKREVPSDAIRDVGRRVEDNPDQGDAFSPGKLERADQVKLGIDSEVPKQVAAVVPEGQKLKRDSEGEPISKAVAGRWIEAESRPTDGSWDRQVVERQAKEVIEPLIAHLDENGWSAVRELPIKGQSASSVLRKLLERDEIQVRWDQEGNSYYNLTGIKKPSWLFNKEDFPESRQLGDPESKPDVPAAEPGAKAVDVSTLKKADVGAVDFPIDKLTTDLKNLQNRDTEFSQKTFDKITSEGIKPDEAQPIVIWQDPATKEWRIVAGHSRTAAYRHLGEKTIPAIVSSAKTLREARVQAVESNYSQDQGTFGEKIRAYRILAQEGRTKTELKNRFGGDVEALEEMNTLDPKGKFIERLSDAALDTDSFPKIKLFARWVGNLRNRFGEKMTNRHEDQIFNWLYLENGYDKNLLQADFYDIVSKQIDRVDWKADNPLVLRRGQGAPLTGTRARKDTAHIEARIDELRHLRDIANTQQEREAIQAQIDEMREGLKGIVENQGDIFGSPQEVVSELIKEQEGEEPGQLHGGLGAVAMRLVRGFTQKATEEVSPEVYGPDGPVKDYFKRTESAPDRSWIQRLKDEAKETFIQFHSLKGDKDVSTKTGTTERAGTYFAKGVEKLRVGLDIPSRALRQALDAAYAVVGRVNRQTYEILRQKVFVEDMIETVQKTGRAPQGITLQDLLAHRQHVDEFMAKDAEARNAYDRHRKIQKAITVDLVKRGKLDAALAYRHYVRNVAMDHYRQHGIGVPKKLRTPGRPYLKERAGGSEHLTDYLAVQFESWSRVFRDNALDDVIEGVARDYHRPPDRVQVNPELFPNMPKDAEMLVAPEGYVAWWPDRYGVRSKSGGFLAAEIADGMEAIVKEMPDGIRQQVMRVVSAHNAEKALFIPKELAEVLDNYKGDVTGAKDNIVTDLTSKWKQTVLNVDPIRYNFRNFVGDTERATQAAPEAFAVKAHGIKLIPRVVSEVWDAMRGKYTKTYELAIKNSVVNAGEVHYEIADVRSMPEFRHLAEGNMTALAKLARHPLKETGQKLRAISELRENVLRYHLFLSNLERMRAGEKPFEGVSDIRGLEDPVEIAAKVSREAMGDYGGLTPRESGWRRSGLPFYSWLKINTTFWPTLFAKRGANVSPIGAAVTVSRRVAQASAIYVAANAWNNYVMGEQEDELPEHVRRKFHINLGSKDAQGNWRVINTPTAFTDFLHTIGLEGLDVDTEKMLAGQMSLKGLALRHGLEMPAAAVLERTTPLITGPVQSITGQKFFPNPLRPSPGKKGVEGLIDASGLKDFTSTDEFADKYLSLDYPQKSMGLQTYRPGIAALQDTEKYIRDFRDEHGYKNTISEGPDTKDKSDLFYALVNEDEEAAAELIPKVDFDRFIEYLERRKPYSIITKGEDKGEKAVADIPKPLRDKFWKVMTEADRERIERAQAFVQEVGRRYAEYRKKLKP